MSQVDTIAGGCKRQSSSEDKTAHLHKEKWACGASEMMSLGLSGFRRCVHHMAPLENDLSGHIEHRAVLGQELTKPINLNSHSDPNLHSTAQF